MQDFALLAVAFRYPSPNRYEELAAAQAAVSRRSTARHFGRFTNEMLRLNLTEWEEIHTRTLDLSPLFVPYIGWVTWGENYQRGEFMAEMKAALDESGVSSRGELPDHLDPVLRYLAVADPPIPSLSEVFPAAIAAMTKKLKEADAASPYLHLLRAIATAAEGLHAPVGGAR